MSIARMLKATAKALRGLKNYYQNVTLTEEVDTQVYLPKPTMTTMTEGSSQPPALLYKDRLFSNDMSRPIYLAKMDKCPVVVKFPGRYSKEAHEMLADQGLAPKLHFCDRIKGRLWMVVMDFTEDVEKDFSKDILPTDAYRDVERAIGLLHAKDLVHGDLRRANIIVVNRARQAGTSSGGNSQSGRQLRSQTRSRTTTNTTAHEGRKGALLIDFDWCGKEGEAKYPETLNDTGDIRWAPGVERSGLMKKEHDEYCLGRFKC